MRLIGFAIYLGIGAMLHALFIGPQFDWSSAWTIGWLIGWPVMVVIACWTFVLAIFVFCILIVCAIEVSEAISRRNARKARAAKAATALKPEVQP